MIKRHKQVSKDFVQDLQQHMSYNPLDGRLRWKMRTCNRVKIGNIVGRTHENGHIEVRFKGSLYMAHHLAWALHYGRFPDTLIGHLNGRKSDNRIANLVRYVSTNKKLVES